MIEGAGPVKASAKAEPKNGLTQFDEAERILSDAARRFGAAGMKYDQAAALNYLGVAAHYQGRLTEARRHYEAAVRTFVELGESTSEVQSLQNIAVIDFQRGDYLEAATAYRRLLAKLDPTTNQRTYLAILNNLALAQYALGQTDQAVRSSLAALPLTESSTAAGDRARAVYALGKIYLTLGEQERGEIFLKQALELRQAKTVQDRQGLLTSLVAVADLKRETGDPQGALKLHMQALDQAVSPQEKARVLLAIGQDQMATGSVSAAVETFGRGLKLDLPEQSTVRYMLLGASGYARSRNGDGEGRALLLKAAQVQEATGDDDYAAETYAQLASEERRMDQIDSAVRYISHALSLYDKQRIRAVNPDLRATYISNRAAAYELQADLYMTLWQRASSQADKERLAASALGTAERLRTLALEDFRQFAQQPAQQQAGAGAVQLAELDSRLAAKRHRLATLQDLDQPPLDQIASLRKEIALLRTQLDVAQQKQAPSKSESRATTAAFSLSKVQASLGSDDVMITWLLGETRSWIWCITQKSANAFPLAPAKDIEKAARELHALWSRPPDGSGNREREVKTSGIILGPAGALLSARRAVTIVADGSLRAIPFGALWVGGQGNSVGAKRLAELATVTYQPALAHWQRAANGTAAAQAGERILLVGDPVLIGVPDASTGVAELRSTTPLDEPWQLPRLPASRREVESIVKIASGWQSDVLLGEAATKAAVLAAPLGTFRIIHFATHARLDVHDPQLSSIRLSARPREGSQNQADLSLRDIVGLGLNADSVVLSACEGSLGKEYRGQLSFGLSEAFLLAGARNVVGSLWRVSDVATEKYMRFFYAAYMTQGLGAVAAAQSAARQLMRDPVYGHPFYWAAFVVLAG
jgi:CHAT domain-containing protein